MKLRYMTNTCCRLILILIALFALNACGGGGSESGQTQNSVNSVSDRHGDRDRRCDDDDDEECRESDGGGTDGASLYQTYCSSCHGRLSNSAVQGASADDIEDAIDDEDRMESLDFLRSYQIEAIADALSGDGGGGGGGGTAAVNIVAIHNPSSSQYDDNCLNCHGDIPNAQSLNSAIPNAHVAMLPFTPGEGSDQCTWCHRDVSNTLIHTMAQVGAFQNNIRKTVDTQLCAICHGPVGPGKPFYQSGLTTSADPDGSELYGYLCSACHRELSNSEVRGESAEEIYGAIADNEGGMAPLSVLNPTWVQAITVALGGDPTLPPTIPAPGTGSSLYQQYCSSCHGALASSSKAGATAVRIQNGIDTEPQMSSLSFLTSTQVQAIADALGGVTGGGGTGGTDGASLYQVNCETCHGGLANSEKAGALAGEIQNAINNDTGGMGVLSSLTPTEVQSIADALSGGTGGGGGGGGLPANHTDDKDGALHGPGKDTPYSSGCTACHGTTLQGDLGPSCFSCHDQKWNEDPPAGGGGGGGLPASHTDDKGGALHMPGKDTPYSSGCTACHGTTLQGDLGPSCFSCHDQKWDENSPT